MLKTSVIDRGNSNLRREQLRLLPAFDELQRKWAALPDALYKGITFTMPDVLWPSFRDNPLVAKALPALATKVIQAQ